MSFKSISISFLVIGLFAFAMFSFASQFQDANEGASTILDNPSINESFGELQADLQGADNEANSQLGVLNGTVVEDSEFNVLFLSIGSIWKVLIGTSVGVYNIVFGIIFDTLLGNSFSAVIGVIGAIISITIISYVWKWVRTGDPD